VEGVEFLDQCVFGGKQVGRDALPIGLRMQQK
jgi:hypothetical protein